MYSCYMISYVLLDLKVISKLLSDFRYCIYPRISSFMYKPTCPICIAKYRQISPTQNINDFVYGEKKIMNKKIKKHIKINQAATKSFKIRIALLISKEFAEV